MALREQPRVAGLDQQRSASALHQPTTRRVRSHSVSSLQRRSAALLNQQFWCWGQDIRHPAGNLLISYGFERSAVPEGIRGSTAYICQRHAALIRLWGFGVCWHTQPQGTVFLQRRGFHPQLLADGATCSAVWELDQLPPTHQPRTTAEIACIRPLLCALLHWIADYETWLQASLGLAYRQQCVAAWRKTKLAASDMPALWQQLAADCEPLIEPVLNPTCMTANAPTLSPHS